MPTDSAYPAAGGGWMALCAEHGEKHKGIATPLADLLAAGEVMNTPNTGNDRAA